jgi:hypothetical protein
MVEHATVNRVVEGSSPSSGANCFSLSFNGFSGFESKTDTETDTNLTIPSEFAIIGVNLPATR